jgi:hypothetical protein
MTILVYMLFAQIVGNTRLLSHVSSLGKHRTGQDGTPKKAESHVLSSDF